MSSPPLRKSDVHLFLSSLLFSSLIFPLFLKLVKQMEHSTPSSHTRPMSGESQAPLISNSEHISYSSPGEISPNSPYFASQALGDLLRVPSSSPVPGHDSAAPPALGEGWSRDWLGIVAAVVAILVLIAWIIAAAILVAVECFLPLDWFGGGSVTADSYKYVAPPLSLFFPSPFPRPPPFFLPTGPPPPRFFRADSLPLNLQRPHQRRVERRQSRRRSVSREGLSGSSRLPRPSQQGNRRRYVPRSRPLCE